MKEAQTTPHLATHADGMNFAAHFDAQVTQLADISPTSTQVVAGASPSHIDISFTLALLICF